MTNDNSYVVKKRCTWWGVLKALIIIAAVTYAAYKIYTKFFVKKTVEVLPEAEDELLAEGEGETFEFDAEDVIVASEEAAE